MRFTVVAVALRLRLRCGLEPVPLAHLVVVPEDDEAVAFDVWPLAPFTLCGKRTRAGRPVSRSVGWCDRCVERAVFMDTALVVLSRMRARRREAARAKGRPRRRVRNSEHAVVA